MPPDLSLGTKIKSARAFEQLAGDWGTFFRVRSRVGKTSVPIGIAKKTIVRGNQLEAQIFART
jgi:hypothetical protein